MKLRDYQNECVDSVFSDISNGVKKMAVVMSTGSGKTCVFGKIVKDYIKDNPYKYVVIISHLGLLTKQTGERFKKDWDIDSEVLRAESIPSGKSKCVITTMQSFSKEYKIRQWGRNAGSFSGKIDVGLIIIDEAHYVGSKTYEKILDTFSSSIVVGFTATPFRSNQLMTDMFEKVSYTISTGELIDSGYLVPPLLKMFKFNKDHEAEMYKSIIEIMNKIHDGEKCVVYLKTIEQSKDLAMILNENKIPSKSITSKCTGEERDIILDNFKINNDVMVLTTVDVLTAGFDSPNLSVIIMPFKVSSVTTYLQRVGRGLRIYKDKKHCTVYCGATSPKVDKGFWERINEQMLKQGRKDFDNYADDLEFLKDQLTPDEYSWTMDVVNLAKAVGKIDMGSIKDMIMSKEFPTDLLNEFIETKPSICNKKLLHQPCTDRQSEYLKDKYGIDGSSLSKGEAIVIFNRMSKIENSYDKRDIVSSGKYAGKFYNEVPFSYFSMLARSNGRYSSKNIINGFKEYKQRKGIK